MKYEYNAEAAALVLSDEAGYWVCFGLGLCLLIGSLKPLFA